MPAHKALIAGVTGAVGNAIAKQLVADAVGPVVGVSRHVPPEPRAGVQYVQLNLDDVEQCNESLRAHLDTTHVYYCGRASHGEQTLENASGNLTLLRNLVQALEPGQLRHVHLVQGGKVYGVHIGPFPNPARESDARAPIENFNYVQEDFLRARSSTQSWTWSASRPNTLLHFSPANPRNLASSLGAYAVLCKELGAVFDFPGPEAAFRSITQVTSLTLLAEAMAWMSRDAACANEAFNVTNGDVFRWSQVWPQIAQIFDLPCGNVRPLRLADTMPIHAPIWDALAARHQLRPLALDAVANWGYLDATLERSWDEIMSTNKARKFGFHGWADSELLLLETLEQYRSAQILP
jgi:nucleoside-diphosphate-sugar epimerase